MINQVSVEIPHYGAALVIEATTWDEYSRFGHKVDYEINEVYLAWGPKERKLPGLPTGISLARIAEEIILAHYEEEEDQP